MLISRCTPTFLIALALLFTLTVQVIDATVTFTKADDGSVTVLTSSYSATIGADGCLQSIKAGGVEFLGRYERFGTASCALDFIPPGNYGVITKTMTRWPLEKPEVVNETTIKVTGKTAQVTYVFREKDLDLITRENGANAPTGTYLLFASPSVTNSRDGVTDQGLDVPKEAIIGRPQNGMRWTTQEGPVLRFDQKIDGYARFLWWDYSGADRVPGAAKCVSVYMWPNREDKFTLTPIGMPTGGDATIDITAPNEDFLVPKGPAVFTVTATNVSPGKVTAEISLEVRDYLTREAINRQHLTLELQGHEVRPITFTANLEKPGPYRGAVVFENAGKTVREIGWIFTYDFAHYQPESTRPPDFERFWKSTLDELKTVPMDVRMTLNTEKSNDKVECYEVSLASLNGRRVWGYYCKPRTEGKYPVVYFCPPTGVYPMYLWVGDGGGKYCTFNIAIHGFDLHLSDMKPDDPWRGYHTLGLSSPQTSAWRWIYASMVRCMDFLVSRPEVDAQRIGITGSSQGGGLATVLAGLDHRAAFLYPTCSGLPRLDWVMKYNTGYWPFSMTSKPADQTEEQFLKTLSYFDMANFTPDIQCPVLARIALLDWVTASGNQIAGFAHIPAGQVQLLCDPWLGHGSMSARVRKESDAALQRFLSGEKPIIHPSK
ncbi:MAG: acetylxylan esterase [Armatimonadota bacterium]